MLTILLYAIIIFAVLYVSAGLGAAMDLSVDDDGVLDFNVLMTQFETVLYRYGRSAFHGLFIVQLQDNAHGGFRPRHICAYEIHFPKAPAPKGSRTRLGSLGE